jgi:membrane protein DedA with SNARE-associated domain
MDHISIGAIRHFTEAHAVIIYIIIYLGVIAEGDIVVILAGILSYLGSLNLLIAFLCIIIAGASKSFLGYTIGSYLQKHHSNNNFIQKIERRLCSFLPYFDKRPFWSIFISRFFLFGIGWFTLIFAGFKKIPLKTYLKAEVPSIIVWSTSILALGYFFGYTALSISRDVRNFMGLIFAFLIMFFLLEKIISFMFELFAIQKIDK